jgi:lipoate-protein ligase A
MALNEMKCLDLTLPTPAANLACDEALLDECEENGGEEILRFWEPREYFVVVGYANHVGLEVNLEACKREKIPVLRRCSGGGTVLQGPGCFNYSLILKIDETSPLQSITSTNRFIMERHKEALSSTCGLPVAVQGFTDLTVGGLKFSGNAQRRKRKALIFHGTFLLDFEIARVETFLPMPSKQPDYRLSRTHGEFLTNVNIPPAMIKVALQQAWNASEPAEARPLGPLLLEQKYAQAEWNFKF